MEMIKKITILQFVDNMPLLQTSCPRSFNCASSRPLTSKGSSLLLCQWICVYPYLGIFLSMESMTRWVIQSPACWDFPFPISLDPSLSKSIPSTVLSKVCCFPCKIHKLALHCQGSALWVTYWALLEISQKKVFITSSLCWICSYVT
jgi:hypothetical protein